MLLEAIRGNTVYVLSDGAPIAVSDPDGGFAPVRRLSDRGPRQDGDTDSDFVLDPLQIQLGLIIYATTIEEHWQFREYVRNIFRPSRTPIKLRYTLDTGVVRQIDCHVHGRLAFAAREMRGYMQRCVVPLRCANPLYYDPISVTQTYQLNASSGSGFVFPISFPVSFGSSAINQTRAIVYDGDYRSYPIIQIRGPIFSPVITNLTTGDKLSFSGITINAGTTYTIDCRTGYKTVTDQDGVSKLADLTNDSDLGTFCLQAADDVPNGINTIEVIGSGANDLTEIYLTYTNWYTGF